MDLALLRYRTGLGLIRLLPKKLAYGIATQIAKIYTLFGTSKKALVQKNLKRVLERQPDAQQVRETFVSYARYYIDGAVLSKVTAKELSLTFEADGYNHIEDSLNKGWGCILALPHMGSWEWAGSWMAKVKGQKVLAVVEPIEPPKLYELLRIHRQEIGINIVPLGPGAGTQLVTALKQNQVVCLLSDRYISGASVEVEFFGEKTRLPAGPATLSLRTGAPILPVGIRQVGNMHHADIRPPIPAVREGRLRQDVGRITQTLAAELEELIQLAPAQWHLMSPNWPSDQELKPG